ncbi:hypothetical protein [Pseudodonghicola sp.]|uniref:hypothetical protein n=1 Tax=Pseudodonghicola sp. TaxID=1969463 RepID=UPI003A97669D
MADLFTDTGVMNESGWGSAGYDESGDFMHLPPKQRREAKRRQLERRDRWQKAAAVRADWTPEQHAAEAARLREEVAANLAARAEEYRDAA